MGAGGPSILEPRSIEGRQGRISPQGSRHPGNQSGPRRARPCAPSVRKEKKGTTKVPAQQINLKQQRRVAEPIQASGKTPNHRGASSQLAALTLMSTPVPVEPPHPQISRGTRASCAKRRTKSEHISETCSNPLKSIQNRPRRIQSSVRSPGVSIKCPAAAEATRKSFRDSSIPQGRVLA